MERDALLDDVMTQQSLLAVSVLTDADGDLDAWLTSRERFVGEWRRVIGDAQHATQQDFSMFAMTCRKLADLARLGDWLRRAELARLESIKAIGQGP